MTTVYDLSSDIELTYSIGARDAVIAAYAQSIGDQSTWEYESRYGHMPRYGKHSVSIGNFAARHDY